MISGIFHQGSGLGDQLMRYITVRTLAEEKGFEWSMVGRKNFKGAFFVGLNFGKEPPKIGVHYYNPTLNTFGGNLPIEPEIYFSNFIEKDIRDEFGNDIRSYDPEINFIEDNTLIDGCFEDEKYWGHNLGNIRKWLGVEPLEMPDDLCVIGFRGGEYATVLDLFLPKEYWDEARKLMIQRHPGMRFEVHTDDPEMAKKFFPIFPIVQGIDVNWRSVRYAKHLIISNSAFYIIPSLIGEAQDIIAPRYWARRNTKKWARPACYYKDKRITYI